ncbi:MAG: arsenite efflux transporter metallochaperone ArsD [Pirellulaceae bacterium]
MKTIRVYDRPLCCSTGVCGPQVDSVLPRFAADLDWLRLNGVNVERFNLAQQPAAFAAAPTIKALLQVQGTDCLPVTVADDQVVYQGDYPSRQQLAAWAEVPYEAPVRSGLPVLG